MFLKVFPGKYKERGNSDPKNMSPRDRIEEFPGENLCLRGGKLFCNGCKEILSSKKSILKKPLGFQKTCRRQREVKSDKKARSCAHMRICHAKDCKTGRWTICMFIKVKIDRVKLLMIFIFLKISVKYK